MVVRLLVVVLTVVGAIPVRVCTCGAAHHHHAPAPKPANDGDRELPPSPSVTPDPAPTEHHDPDCHAVRPHPLMSVGLQLDVTDVPVVDAPSAALADCVQPAPLPGEPLRDFHPPPNRPLFLSLCVLRN